MFLPRTLRDIVAKMMQGMRPRALFWGPRERIKAASCWDPGIIYGSDTEPDPVLR